MDIYPRSFLRLILLGKGLVVLPLLLAIAYSVYMLQHMAADAESYMLQSTELSKLNWELPEELNHLERSLRQYEVLRDKSLLDDYAAIRREWRESALRYGDFPALADIGKQMTEFVELEAASYARLRSGAGDSAALRAVLADIRGRTNATLEIVNARLEHERLEFRQHADVLRERLWIAQGISLVTTALLVAFWRHLLARLLRGVEGAVRLLGSGRLEQRIRLRGPDDIRRIGRRLEWLRRRLLSLEEQRNLTLRHVSHELKTPLAALREGASLLAEGAAGELSPAQRRIADIMQGNSIRLQDLIDNLLKLQHAGYAGDRFEPGPVRLDQIISSSLKAYQLATRNKKLRLFGSLAPLEIEGGEEELRALIDNMISNAIKFTPEGGQVRIDLTLNEGNAVVDVADTGPGIAEDDRQRAFEPFFRGRATREIAGSGLGLAIAREYALAHRGTLEFIDAECGAHLRATLPVQWANAA